jgi:hypothetical protein
MMTIDFICLLILNVKYPLPKEILYKNLNIISNQLFEQIFISILLSI